MKLNTEKKVIIFTGVTLALLAVGLQFYPRTQFSDCQHSIAGGLCTPLMTESYGVPFAYKVVTTYGHGMGALAVGPIVYDGVQHETKDKNALLDDTLLSLCISVLPLSFIILARITRAHYRN